MEFASQTGIRAAFSCSSTGGICQAPTTTSCTPNWFCSYTNSPCTNGQQTQSCTNLNGCEVTINQPTPATQSCVTQSPAPQITSISPNPVPAISGKQWVTINGKDFVSGLKIILRTGNNEVYTIPITSAGWVNPTQVKIYANFTLQPASWTAQAVNPDGKQSNLFNFSVQAPVQQPVAPSAGVPDLVVENVKISPSVTRAGTPITVSFTIRNQGNGDANVSTARIRLSLDNIITSSDENLGEVATPALVKGAAVPLTKLLTVPTYTAAFGPVTPGLYYVGVTADVNSTAGQTNESNDKAVQFLSIY